MSSTTATTTVGSSASAQSISGELKWKILELQAQNRCTWAEACDLAAQRLEAEGFRKLVDAEVESRLKSYLLKRVNKMRTAIRKKAKDEVRTWEDNFHVPCKGCGKPMHFSNSDANWEEKEKPILVQAFGKWSHTTCR